MSIENLPPLIVPPQINSNLQIVCNYLKLLKSGKLAEKDLYIKSVSFEGIQDMLDPQLIQNYQKVDGVSLPQKECEEFEGYLPKVNDLLEKIEEINDENYFSHFVFYLYNFERWFYNKKGRQKKVKKSEK